jgi:NTE family protein
MTDLASPMGTALAGHADRDDSAAPEPGVALCLSGGGYRAMVFHVGVLWRLYELNALKSIKRISSVSGGSITAAVLATRWTALSFDPAKVRQDFVPEVVKPLRDFASRTIDAGSVIGGILLPGVTISDMVAQAYRDHLFGNMTLQDLPDQPRFVINATNVQSGVLWRFSKDYMRDWKVGMVRNPTISLGTAVAASSAFPPVLSPLVMELDPDSFEPGSGDGLQQRPYTSRVVLTDGGVYDNLGLETIWKRYDTILVSDAGGLMPPEPDPKEDWAQHARRILDVVDNQVRDLRKRQVVGSYKDGSRKGTYWGIRTDIADYAAPGALPCPHPRTMLLAEIATRLKAMDSDTQERLINWGYAVTDAAMRKYVVPGAAPPAAFPYPVGV